MKKKRFCPSTQLCNLSKSQFAYFYGNSWYSSYSFHTIKKCLDLPFLTSEMSCRIRGLVYLSCVQLSAPASLFSNIREVLQCPCSSCRQHIKRLPHKIFLSLDAWWESSDCYWHFRVRCKWCHIIVTSCDSWLDCACTERNNSLSGKKTVILRPGNICRLR